MKSIDLETALQTQNRNKYDHKQLVDAVKAVIKAKNIVCMAGAGISTSAGIPVSLPQACLHRSSN